MGKKFKQPKPGEIIGIEHKDGSITLHLVVSKSKRKKR